MKPTYSDILYRVVDDVSLYLDIYLPAMTPATPTIYLHAGGFTAGSRRDHDMRFTRPMLDAGYAVVMADYRLSPAFRWPAHIDDARAAVEFIRAHGTEYALEIERLGAWGHSAGGHLAALLGAMGDVDAVVDFYGSTDLAAFASYTSELRDPDMNAQVNRDIFGAEGANDSNQMRMANPAVYLNTNSAPTLLIHGRRDGVVPPDQSERYYRALQKAGIESELILLDDAEHDVPDEHVHAMTQRMIAFLQKFL